MSASVFSRSSTVLEALLSIVNFRSPVIKHLNRRLCSMCHLEQTKLSGKQWICSKKVPTRQKFWKSRFQTTCNVTRNDAQDCTIFTLPIASRGVASFAQRSPDISRQPATLMSGAQSQLLSGTGIGQSRSFHCSCIARSFENDAKADTSPTIDPFKLMESEMVTIVNDIKKELRSEQPVLEHMSQYYFNGKGKAFRPLVSLLMAKACNAHSQGDNRLSQEQRIVAMVSEMIHTASLVHDDVIDASDTRRNQASLNVMYGQRKAILTGDFILSRASIAVARTNHPQVIKILASILVDLVSGEFMQLGSKENENERFKHYFEKTYKKTASLIANSCQSVAILGGCADDVVESSFQYGRHLGLAFQLIDDLLDFTSCESEMGKPTAADLKQGLATAPVLFAAQEFPDLHAMIMRRFCEDGDVEFARNAVEKSRGVEQTRLLATQHSQEAVNNLRYLTHSDARAGLIRLARILLERKN